MKRSERIAMLRAMERIARTVNDEGVFVRWLNCGIADGDIQENTPDSDLDFYTDDEVYADVMDTFLRVMSDAYKDGGLYSDGVVSKSTN